MKIKKNKLLYISNLAWNHKDFPLVIGLIKKHNFRGIDVAPLQINHDWNKIESKMLDLSKKLHKNKIKINALQGIFYKKNYNLFKDYYKHYYVHQLCFNSSIL